MLLSNNSRTPKPIFKDGAGCGVFKLVQNFSGDVLTGAPPKMTSAILIPILGEKIALDCILLADDFYFTVCIVNWKLFRNKKDMTV